MSSGGVPRVEPSAISPGIALSVLDQAPTRVDRSPAAAIREVAALARHVEALGFRRFWIAEHHALGAVASTAPEVLIGHVADATERLSVGAGAMLLPNHRPLHVAELFRMLAALHPGRIDLGVGRSEGALDPAIVAAFERSERSTHAGGYEEMLDELLAFAGIAPLAPDHPLAGVTAGPEGEPFPELFMLGSSANSAATAGARGLGYGFAAYSAPDVVADALEGYRRAFRPGARPSPHAILGVRVIVGEDDAHAEALAAPGRLALAQARAGRPQPMVDPETALAHRWSEAEQAAAAQIDGRADAIGGPETVAAKLRALLSASGADELIVTTNTFSAADRRDSYTRLARLWGSLSAETAAAMTSGRLQKAKRTSVGAVEASA